MNPPATLFVEPALDPIEGWASRPTSSVFLPLRRARIGFVSHVRPPGNADLRIGTVTEIGFVLHVSSQWRSHPRAGRIGFVCTWSSESQAGRDAAAAWPPRLALFRIRRHASIPTAPQGILVLKIPVLAVLRPLSFVFPSPFFSMLPYSVFHILYNIMSYFSSKIRAIEGRTKGRRPSAAGGETWDRQSGSPNAMYRVWEPYPDWLSF